MYYSDHRCKKIKLFFISMLLSLPVGAYDQTIMRIGDNVNPVGKFPSTTNDEPFDIGSEFRMVNPDGFLGGGSPLNKNLFNGTEEWHFDNNGVMTNVMFTAMSGGVASDPYYEGQSAAPEGGLGIGQGADFFFSPFDFLAPYIGSNAAAVYGAARLTILSRNKFIVYFPVLEVQWNLIYLPLGEDSGGITFDCTGDPAEDFHCTGEELIEVAEDPTSAGFAGWTAQWEFGSARSSESGLSLEIGVVGGTTQECSSPNGANVAVQVNVIVPPDEAVDRLSWTADGEFLGFGQSVSTQLSMGTHTIEVTARSSAGEVQSKSTDITVVDTTPPSVAPYFANIRDNMPISRLSRRHTFAKNRFNVSDLCDPAPTMNANLGIPSFDGDFLFIRKDQGIVRLPADELKLMVTATDASGNVGVGETNLLID